MPKIPISWEAPDRLQMWGLFTLGLIMGCLLSLLVILTFYDPKY